ncbi:MAG: efflux transporter outer membrane subunit [Chlorobiales bacterium]|nr:efflux transporter outer membrane subunit [Chlorobiales bacterium]
MRRKRTGLFLFAVLLVGCSAGPDFVRPDPPKSSGYSSNVKPAHFDAGSFTLGDAQTVIQGEVSAMWWEQFRSGKLNDMITQALLNSPTLEAAKATLLQAEYLYKAKGGSTLYPRIDANAGALRQETNGSKNGQVGGENTFNLLNSSLSAGYTFDLSGSNHRQLESLAAKAGYYSFQLEGARLTLAADIATTAIYQAQLSGQITILEKVLAARLEQLAITRERLRLGSASPQEVLAMQALIEQTRAGIPALRNQLDQTMHLLALLSGQTPDSASLPLFALQDFFLPLSLPLRVPSELVRVRPDIQASEALMRAANADYGAAVAKSFPQITLSATIGSQALTAASLFGTGSLVWGVAGQLVQPIFNKGLAPERDAAKAGFDAASANYHQTVLKGLREVADVLTALDNNKQILSGYTGADAAAQEQLMITGNRYKLGSASYLELLQAQSESEQYRLELLASQARRLSDTVAFYQAMGGGRK